MVTENTVRRRRSTAETSSTTSEVPSTPVTASATTRSLKTTPELLNEEKQSLKNFVLLTASLIAFFIFMVINTPLPPPGRVCAIMIDAGSTGTRAQVFTFRKDPETKLLVLDKTRIFKEQKSLAALATGTASPGPFFKPLLEKVKKAVPGIRRRKRTPIALRATAGLRLLGIEASEHALEQARTALNASEFLFKPEWVSVLDEQEEAKYAWTTVNFLKGGLHSGLKKDLVGALDLGGASLQIVYQRDGSEKAEEERAEDGSETEDYQELRKSTSERDTKVKVLGREYSLHTTSYLGLGLFDFIKKLCTLFDREGVLEEGNPCFRKDKLFEGKTLKLGVPGSEEIRVVTMRGDGDFKRCVASAEIAIGTFSNLFSTKNRIPKDKSFYAFAYFYDRTVGLGLPASATKTQLEAKGKALCETSAEDFEGDDRDEACAEFSYIYALLKIFTNNFAESEGVKIRFEQFVGGHMLGWALGATLETIQPVMQEQLALDKESLIVS